MKRKIITTLAITLLTIPMVNAVDYTIDGVPLGDFYPSTAYEDVYHTQYQYGGKNVIDFTTTALPYGLPQTTSIGVLDGAPKPVNLPNVPTVTVPTVPVVPTQPSGTLLPGTTVDTTFTAVEDLIKSDDSLGYLRIPCQGVSTKVYAGETAESMFKGVGHFATTSAWNGNVGMCGHNRGTSYVFGNLKYLDLGDKMTYTTAKGTRTYAVTHISQISSTDWSYLSATTDNRLTLITCVENQPALRWCIQAVEVS